MEIKPCLISRKTNKKCRNLFLLQNAKSVKAESKLSVTSRSNSLILDWEDNSGCASQLTALNLKIFKVNQEFCVENFNYV